jgi:hypothetical protein
MSFDKLKSALADEAIRGAEVTAATEAFAAAIQDKVETEIKPAFQALCDALPAVERGPAPVMTFGAAVIHQRTGKPTRHGKAIVSFTHPKLQHAQIHVLANQHGISVVVFDPRHRSTGEMGDYAECGKLEFSQITRDSIESILDFVAANLVAGGPPLDVAAAPMVAA